VWLRERAEAGARMRENVPLSSANAAYILHRVIPIYIYIYICISIYLSIYIIKTYMYIYIYIYICT